MADTTSGWPSAVNTGVPAGVTLTPSGSLIINTPGAVISGLDIRGTVYINAPNVTLINCKITSAEFYVVKVNPGITGAVVQNCEINGVGTGNDGNHGIAGQGTFTANNIYNVENGITLQGNNSLIQDNYIHDLKASGSPHYDGIQIDGGISNATISHNTVINNHNQTAAVMIDNYFGPISNITVDNNILVGGGYTIYSDAQFSGGSITGVSITNNHIGGGYWGPTNFNKSNPVYTGNVNDGVALAQSLPTTGQPPATNPPSAPTIASFSNDSGVAGDGVTNDNTLTLSGSAAANSTVKVFDGTTQIGSVTANANGTWSYTTAALSDGNHSLTAKVTTAAGTSAASSALSLKIDTTAPTAPTIGTTGTASAGSATTLAATAAASGNTVTLSGTAEAGSIVKVYDGTTQIGTATANSSGAWGYTTGALAAGSHTLTAKATDAAGNTSTASSPLAVNIDGTGGGGGTGPAAPKIVSYSNDTGAKGDGITNDNTITLSGSAAANSTVKVFDGTTQIGTANVNSNGTWTYTTATLTDGSHSLTAKVTDAYGNTSAASSPLSLTIDTKAPTAPKFGSFSTDGKLVTDGVAHVDDVTLTGTAEANSTVKLFDGTTQIGTAQADAKGNWTYLAKDLADGKHAFTSTAVDAAGNTSGTSTALNVTVDADTTPKPTLSAEFNGAYQKWNDTVVFRGTADPYSKVTIYDNGGTKAIGMAKADADGKWSLTSWSPLSDKTTHAFTATVTDSAGNTGASTGTMFLGTNGDNRLVSTTGDDLFKGHGGNDTFVFAPNFGQDTITDFRAYGRGHDVVEFSKSVFDDFASVLAHASQQGNNVVIDAGGGNTLTLRDTKLTSLDKTDFHFV